MVSDEKARGLDARAVRRLLFEIGNRIAEAGQTAEIAIYGGSALLLEVGAREATKDVDYVTLCGSDSLLLQAADEVASRYGLETGWLNDAVGIFISDKPDYRLVGDFPSERPGLRVFRASAEYMLAMKLMSMRSALESNDVRDVWDLVDRCGVSTADEARSFLARFYPGQRLPRRNSLILEDLFEAKGQGQEYSPALGW